MDLLKVRREIDRGKNIYDLPLRVAFYARVSTDRNEQLNSLTNQVSYYEEFIRTKQNWTYSGGYIDEGISGTSVNRRENFLRMIQDARDNKFDLIITKEISRFSRSTLDSIKYTQELLDCGVGVYFQNDNINTLNTDAELRLAIMASIAQDEVRRLSERIKFGMRRAHETGKVLGCDNIYGYNKQNGKLTINEKEAEFVRTLFNIYAEGKYGFRTIVRKLSDMGFTNQSGKEINPGTLRQILENPKYKGYYHGRITESNNYRQKKNIKLDEQDRLLYKDPTIPAIVPEEIWDKANVLLLSKREKFKKKSDRTQNRFSYSGKVLCEEHNAYHYRKVWKDRKEPLESWCCKVYLAKGRKECSTPHIHTKEIDAIMEHIGKLFIQDKQNIIGALISRYENIEVSGIDYARELAKLESEANRVMDKKEKLLEMSLDCSIDKEEFKTMNGRLNEQLSIINQKLEKLKSEQANSENRSEMLRQAKEILEKRIDEDQLPIELAQELLHQITVKKESTKEHIRLDISMKYGKKIRTDLLRLSQNSGVSDSFILYNDTEISPIVGTEKQSEDLINYLTSEMSANPNKIWELNMFGKSMHDMVKDGLQSKLFRMPEDAQMKLQETLQKIINEGSGGLICIIL